jgi:hypothetical protein
LKFINASHGALHVFITTGGELKAPLLQGLFLFKDDANPGGGPAGAMASISRMSRGDQIELKYTRVVPRTLMVDKYIHGQYWGTINEDGTEMSGDWVENWGGFTGGSEDKEEVEDRAGRELLKGHDPKSQGGSGTGSFKISDDGTSATGSWKSAAGANGRWTIIKG